jgi:hypothetical protein
MPLTPFEQDVLKFYTWLEEEDRFIKLTEANSEILDEARQKLGRIIYKHLCLSSVNSTDFYRFFYNKLRGYNFWEYQEPLPKETPTNKRSWKLYGAVARK